MRRIDRFVLAGAGGAALLTVLPYTSPRIPIQVTSPGLRLILDTAQALIALLFTHLSYGRFRRSGLLSDLLLAYGMGLFGVANLLILSASLAGAPSEFHIWAPLLTRLIGAGAVVWAAWNPQRRYTTTSVAPKLMGAHAITLLSVAGIVSAFSDRLPLAITSTEAGLGSSRPQLEAHGAVLAAQLVLMLLYWTAAWGFTRPRPGDSDALTIALATGFLLAGFSRLNFFLYPSLYTDLIDTGDFLRIAWYLSLLVGAEREIESYWNRLAEAAVTEERRRTARELHDGLVQELSFINSRLPMLSQATPDPLALEQVTTAAERALQESRLAIQTLSGESQEDLDLMLRRAAEEVAGRAGAIVQIENPSGAELPSHARVVIARILREACSNAVRHGQAHHISVRIEPGRHGEVRMTVADDGAGFDPDATEMSGGFGLTSMRERAESLGGDLRVISRPGEGTTVEVSVPGS